MRRISQDDLLGRWISQDDLLGRWISQDDFVILYFVSEAMAARNDELAAMRINTEKMKFEK